MTEWSAAELVRLALVVEKTVAVMLIEIRVIAGNALT